MKNNLTKGLGILMIMFTSFVSAQSITGKVSDASGPLPGATVNVKGTTNSTATDVNGAYELKNAGSKAVLVFSYIGLDSQEVNAAGRSVVNVTLNESKTELKDVVVIGYGSVKKKDATGAVDQISSKKFDNVAATSPAELLRGKVAGVQITSSSGEPGANATIRIRGNGSIRSGNDPLIVIDGVPMAGGDISAGASDIGLGSGSPKGPLNFVNQNDIESMSILKDASSTAIYGARGANGVIIITTKKGKSKEPQLTYSTSLQTSSYKGNLDVLSADRFAQLAPAANNKGSRSYNWKDAVLQDGFTMNHDVAFSKSDETSNTRFSVSATNTDGIVKNTGMDKYTANFNNSNDFFNGRLRVDSRLAYSSIKDRTTLITNNSGYIGNLIGAALYWNPTQPIYNADGSYYSFGNGGPQGPNDDDYINPVQLLNSYTDYTDTNKLIGSINTTLKISNSLKYNLVFGVEQSSSARKSQLAPSIHLKDIAQATALNNGVKKYGQATIDGVQNFAKTFENILNYNKNITENINLNADLGYSYYSYNYSGSTTVGKGFDKAQVDLIDNIEGGIQEQFRAYSYKNKNEMQSFFARTRFMMYNKFNLDLTVRKDGSTKPGANKKYGNFASVGAAYKIVENKEGLLNNLKIRGSYGTTGNINTPKANLAAGVASYGLNGSTNIDNNESVDLAWEKTTSYGIGLDFTLLKNRLTGSVDYFNRSTAGLIASVPAASVQPGPPSPKYINLDGTLVNNGVEVVLNYKIIDKEDFSWDFSANASFLKNKMQDFVPTYFTGAVNGQGLTGAYAQIITDNTPLYSYYVYDWVGYDAAGASIYKDAAGNNTSLGFAAKSILDKQPIPTMNLGFSTSVAYKNFDASVSFYGAYGHYLYNNTANALFYKGAFGVKNVTENVATSTQATGDPNSPSTKYIEKGDFLRMGNLTFGYNFSSNILRSINVKAARIFVNGSNLLLFTDYTGFDPEVDINKSMNNVPSVGMDYLAYPKAKSLSFGLNVTF